MSIRNAILTIVVCTAMILVGSGLLSAAVAGAHDAGEQIDWWQDWQQRLSVEGETPALMAEAVTFSERHEVAPYRPPVFGTTTNRGMGTNVEQWRPLVAGYGGWNVDIMMCLMGKESGGNPNAKNPTSSATGLFQVLASLWGPKYPGNLYDPVHNVWVAHQIWQQQGYGAWSPWNRGSCR